MLRLPRVKSNMSDADKEIVRSVAHEFINNRIESTSAKQVKDLQRLAYVSGLHQVCLDLSFRRIEYKPGDPEFGVGVFAVNSAYELAHHQTLSKLSVICADKMIRFPGDVTSSLDLCRVLWRLVCLLARSKQEHETVDITDSLSRAWAQLVRVCPSAEQYPLATFIRRTKLFILYASRADDGEMLFFKYCLQERFLRQPTAAAPATARETFLVDLLKTCRRGNFSEAAMDYFRAEQKETQSASFSRAVLFSLLQVFSGKTRAQDAILKLAREIIHSSAESLAEIPDSFWYYVVNAAGESHDEEMSHFVASHVMRRSLDPTSPLQDESLVFVTLQAVARCGTSDFVQKFLEPCIAAKIISPGEQGDAITYLLLYHNMTCVDAEAKTLDLLNDPSMVITQRVASLVIKILSRADSDRFFAFYKRITTGMGAHGASFFRLSWLEELILYADRRRYSLSEADRQFVVNEVTARVGFVDVEGDVKGLDNVRNSIAILKHDEQHHPLDAMKRRGAISPPPKLFDSRLQFISRRQSCVSNAIGNIIQCVGHPRHLMDLDVASDEATAATSSFHVFPAELREEEVRAYLLSKLPRSESHGQFSFEVASSSH
jgi:hypothetical protein